MYTVIASLNFDNAKHVRNSMMLTTVLAITKTGLESPLIWYKQRSCLCNLSYSMQDGVPSLNGPSS